MHISKLQVFSELISNFTAMRLADLQNYFFLPDSATSSAGTVYELIESFGFDKNSFVLLPYQNPQTKKPEQKFYCIKSRTRFSFPEKETSNEHTFPILLKSQTNRLQYLEKIKGLNEHIQRGNIYEINYCIQFYAEDVFIDPINIFIHLHQVAKAPYSSLLKLGDDYILCASPELFLKKEGTRISTKPIKGTARRGSNPTEDEFLKTHLQTNLKERTENVMAVDVARNDLSRFAAKGTVQVNKLYNIETFETVHQMVSTVSCEIKDNSSFDTIIESTFPMASMTGAPKLRAMTLIDEFENFERRNYSGAMGIIDENGDYTLSVIIRSIFYNEKTKSLNIAVGGAITYLSDPEKEYEECLLKAKALLRVLNAEIV
jgi:para-aminobenzoate synthetase component 1